MKTAQDFILEIPVLKNSDLITKARQILWDCRFRVTATKSNVTVEGFVKDSSMANPEYSIEQVAKTMKRFHTDSAAVVDSSKHMQGGACWYC